MLFVANVKGDVWLISFSTFLSFLYMRPTDFFELNLYGVTLVKIFISYRSSLVEFLGSIMYAIIWSANNESLTSFFLIWIPLISFCHLIPIARTSRTMLKRYGDNGQPCLVPNFSGIALRFSPLNLMLTACCKLLSLSLDVFLVFLISPRPLSWRGVGFCWLLSQHLMRWSYVFSFSLFLWWITLIDFHMLNYPCISGMKPTWSWS